MSFPTYRNTVRHSRLLPALALVVLAGVLSGPAMAQYETVSVAIEGMPGLRICMTCHGAYGQGNPAVGGPKLSGMEPWYLRRQLNNFRAQIRGLQKDYIPGYEMRDAVSHLSDKDIDSIVMEVSTWQEAPVHSTVAGDPARGQQLYATCAACHGAGAEGNEALSAPALAGRSDWYLLNQLKLFKSGYRGSHPEDTAGAQMRQMLQGLETETDMQDVVSYIGTLN